MSKITPLTKSVIVTIFLFFTSFLSLIFINNRTYQLEAPFKFFITQELSTFILVSFCVFLPLIIFLIGKDKLFKQPIKMLYKLPIYSIVVSIILGTIIAILSFGWFLIVSLWVVVITTIASLFFVVYLYFSKQNKLFDTIIIIFLTVLLLAEVSYIGYKAFPSLVNEDFCGPKYGTPDYTCFGNKAISENNINICNELTPFYAKARCSTMFALDKKDVSFCDLNINYNEVDNTHPSKIYEQNSCYRKFFEQVDVSICENNPECYTNYYDGKEKVCMAISPQSMVRECYDNLFLDVTSNNPICNDMFSLELFNSCENIQSTGDRCECYGEIYVNIDNNFTNIQVDKITNLCNKIYIGKKVYSEYPCSPIMLRKYKNN